MDFASLATAASSFGATINIAKAALEIRDFNATGAAISEMTQKLLDLQSQLLAVNASFFELQQERVALAEKVRVLEEQRSQRERYSLFEIGTGVFVYRFNAPPEGSGAGTPGQQEPAHFLCQACWDRGSKSVLQNWTNGGWKCLPCNINLWERRAKPVQRTTRGI